MSRLTKKSSGKTALMILLALGLSLPLTACQSLGLMVNDPYQECDHPYKPDKPYTDENAALYISAQGEKIDKCRALLGHS